jgi:hypothetical protein
MVVAVFFGCIAQTPMTPDPGAALSIVQHAQGHAAMCTPCAHPAVPQSGATPAAVVVSPVTVLYAIGASLALLLSEFMIFGLIRRHGARLDRLLVVALVVLGFVLLVMAATALLGTSFNGEQLTMPATLTALLALVILRRPMRIAPIRLMSIAQPASGHRSSLVAA